MAGRGVVQVTDLVLDTTDYHVEEQTWRRGSFDQSPLTETKSEQQTLPDSTSVS